MVNQETQHIFSVAFGMISIDPTAPEYGQISFSYAGHDYTFVLPRAEFERLGRSIGERAKAVPLRELGRPYP